MTGLYCQNKMPNVFGCYNLLLKLKKLFKVFELFELRPGKCIQHFIQHRTCCMFDEIMDAFFKNIEIFRKIKKRRKKSCWMMLNEV